MAKLDKVDTLRTFAEYLCRTASKTYYRDNPCKEFTDISYALDASAESSLQKTVYEYDTVQEYAVAVIKQMEAVLANVNHALDFYMEVYIRPRPYTSDKMMYLKKEIQNEPSYIMARAAFENGEITFVDIPERTHTSQQTLSIVSLKSAVHKIVANVQSQEDMTELIKLMTDCDELGKDRSRLVSLGAEKLENIRSQYIRLQRYLGEVDIGILNYILSNGGDVGVKVRAHDEIRRILRA